MLLYLPRSKELKIIKVGLRISVGWKEKLNSFYPPTSTFCFRKKNIVDIDNKIENIKNKIERIIKFLIDNFRTYNNYHKTKQTKYYMFFY